MKPDFWDELAMKKAWRPQRRSWLRRLLGWFL